MRVPINQIRLYHLVASKVARAEKKGLGGFLHSECCHKPPPPLLLPISLRPNSVWSNFFSLSLKPLFLLRRVNKNLSEILELVSSPSQESFFFFNCRKDTPVTCNSLSIASQASLSTVHVDVTTYNCGKNFHSDGGKNCSCFLLSC